LNFGTNLGGRSSITFPNPTSSQILFRWTKSTYGQILSNVGAAPPPVRLRQPYGRLRPTGGFAKFNKKYLNASRRVFFAELRKAAPTLCAILGQTSTIRRTKNTCQFFGCIQINKAVFLH
jgi:hypothetical protein